VDRLTVLEDERSRRLIDKLRANGLQNRHQSLQLIPKIVEFRSGPSVKLEVLVRVMELALHDRKKILQEALVRAASEMSPHINPTRI
jgi:hypothetical protein